MLWRWKRAKFLAETTWDAIAVVDDCARIMALRERSGELNGADCARIGREWADKAGEKRELGVVHYEGNFGKLRFVRAMAVVCFGRALRAEPDNAALFVERARQWAHIGQRERAEADLDRARDLTGETIESWRIRASLMALMGEEIAAGQAFACAVRLGVASGEWSGARDACLARSVEPELPRYQQLAWLDYAVENAPADVELRLERARWHDERSHKDAAREDYDRAIALRPDDAELVEARAAHQSRFGDNELALTDYESAIRLRLALGLWDDDAKSLKKHAKSYHQKNWLKSVAIYGVAIERAPRDHSLYLGRARLLEKPTYFLFPLADDAPLGRAGLDWLRALALQPQLETPRRAIVIELAESARRPTAHEQLEALLATRQMLRDNGLTDELANRIIADVQARWALEPGRN